ncbi:hypothetical protein A2999_01845 [Candidatus Wolfebacteria bacterium RIFCSPLOWO2_01_FULL_38_11]|uniref:(P)ppGpp synthetase I, SpoT/RelA n=2 Tax=Candidatus Wolfeibacteriota TaxID=1752735 RepID=A0A0G0IFR4_9BACT|nr:MAG: (P)ppGpp synthetase I, SpoT/RelA [Candidatus Wolfebacteria bacterium GW2011_GWC1_37_10]OGM90684.1 MAG: hypothetical protein A2999_01845 [Candidatus Wolfebacteria bacterium RIFCSPLOWO2_01_FULL_38_11]
MVVNVKNLLAEAQKTREFSKTDIGLIEKAFVVAQKAHQGQKRKSGEPYFNHSYNTALKLAEWQLDAKTVCAGLLHDVAEDTKTSLEEIKKEFGEEISFLVDGVTKLGKFKYRVENGKSNSANHVQLQAENIRKMLLAISQDLRVILIKLADRLHNMKTLSAIPIQKQKRIALETSEIYAPLAYRLGMQNLSGELEDLAFPYLYPDEYRWLIENVKEKYEEREKYLEKVKIVIEKNLKESGIEPEKIDFRAKRYSSLYKKLLHQNMNLEQIYDLVALRIIVKTVEECYSVLGIIHQLWPPMPGRIKDYIAMPKPNGYRSLHTTVLCLDNKPTELQIRTTEMHQEAENGIAAHWLYQQKKKGKDYLHKKPVFAEQKELAWVEQLRNWQKEFSDSEEFLQSLKIDFLKDRMFVMTPKGKVVDLPVNATPIDFAYAIHTDIGDHCVGARINNKIVPLDYQLQSGDLVEILTQKSKKPSESWLHSVKTNIAKKKIRAAIKEKEYSGLLKSAPVFEFKIVALDRIGLLKDISSIFYRSHINIQSTNTSSSGNYRTIKIRCEIDKEKAAKVVLKLKESIKEIKEVGYKIMK